MSGHEPYRTIQYAVDNRYRIVLDPAGTKVVGPEGASSDFEDALGLEALYYDPSVHPEENAMQALPEAVLTWLAKHVAAVRFYGLGVEDGKRLIAEEVTKSLSSLAGS